VICGIRYRLAKFGVFSDLDVWRSGDREATRVLVSSASALRRREFFFFAVIESRESCSFTELDDGVPSNKHDDSRDGVGIGLTEARRSGRHADASGY
jgi:hypothetical protein